MRRLWFSVRIEARLAIGLMSMLIALLSLVDMTFGVLPTRAEALAKVRWRRASELAEPLMETKQSASSQDALSRVAGRARRDPEILYVALRYADGEVVPIHGDRRQHWTLSTNAPSTSTQIRIAVRDDLRAWGVLEVAFADPESSLLSTWLHDPVVRALLTLGFLGTATVYLYLRRVMRQLMPYQSMPQRAQDAFDVLDQAILLLDAKGRVMMANRAFLKLRPDTAPVAVDKPISQFAWLLEAIGRLGIDPPWSEAQRLGDGAVECEIVVAAAGGREARYLVLRATPIVDASGRPRGSVVTLSDSSELRRINREFKSLLLPPGLPQGASERSTLPHWGAVTMHELDEQKVERDRLK